ncbi:MAG: shikimate dehydrogenase [Terriglobia bacterium]
MTKHLHPRVFVTIAAPTLAAMEDQASNAGSSQTGFEWRLDYLQGFEDLEARMHQMLFRLRFPQSIATCRRLEAGGLFKGTIEEQAAVIEAAVSAGCHWVDFEAGSVRGGGGAALLERFKNVKIVVSHHDYRTMPALGEIYRKLSRLPVQVVKIAAHAHNLADNLKVEKFLRAHRGAGPKVVAFAMGPCGIPSRLLSLKWGCHFTYASAGSHIAVASGQLPAPVMRTVYRVEHLDHRTQIYGVVGSRASVSLSPSMQNAAFNAKRVNAIYLPCETSQLSDFLKLARQMRFGGFSVTMPYKRAIIKELDWIDPLAAQIGACNTVAMQRGKWMGWNTDAAAVVEVLTKRLRLAGSRILILGAGGAARSAAFALRGEGAGVFIAARREAVARQLARSVSAQVVPWGSADGLDVDAVINATPIGMSPNAETVPIDLARLRVRVVLDMVYYPMETRFLAEARGRGITTISGLEMLVDQGARQFEIWTGQSAPRALMEQAVRQGFDHTDMD